jgi:RNA polymerase sigma-70 factor (ECF subfamily)
MMNDVQLVELLKQRHAAGFDELLSQYGSKMYRIALRIVRKPEDVEDVIQDTLLIVFQKIQTFDGRGPFVSWLCRILVNAALMRLRKTSRTPTEPLCLDGFEWSEGYAAFGITENWSFSAEKIFLRREAAQALKKGIGALPDNYRTVYVLAEIEGLPHQEVASILSLTTQNVKTRLHRARLCLRQVVENYFTERSAIEKKSH